jgi:probable HAF family extracellular repeat protein
MKYRSRLSFFSLPVRLIRPAGFPHSTKRGNMKSKTLIIFITAMTFLTAMAVTAQGQQEDSKGHRRCKVTDIGTLGGTFGQAFGINNEGWVVGYATITGDTAVHAFLWRKGVMTDLGSFGGPISQGIRINGKGEVIGASDSSVTDPLGEQFCFSNFGDSNECLPFLWRNGVMTPLAILGGDNGVALGINNEGIVVGQVENTIHDPTCVAPQVLQYKPVFWEEGEIEDLPTLPGFPNGVGAAINDRAQVVGAYPAIEPEVLITPCSGTAVRRLTWETSEARRQRQLASTTKVKWSAVQICPVAQSFAPFFGRRA